MPLANGFAERMADARAAAQHRRNRGQATGGKCKAHATFVTVDGWEFHKVNAKCRWDSTRADAQEDYRRAAFPDRYDMGEW